MSTTLDYTPVDQISQIRDELRKGFYSGKLKSIEYRKYQLIQLSYAIKDNLEKFHEALKHDLGREPLESDFMELAPTMSEIKTSIDGVASWSKTEKAPFSVNFAAMRPTIRKEPKGTVLIVAPFNYPILLLIGPLAGALAAGNTVLLKPSEQTPATTSLLTDAIHKYLDSDLVRVVNGAIPETSKLLELQWDYILYTGGERVGRIVATAAAQHTTPISLELGGKSPVIVDPNCDLATAAKRIIWGKGVNAGQTCTAPDFVLVPESFQDKLIEAFKVAHAQFWPSEDSSFPHLVSDAAYDRIHSAITNSKGTVVIGGTEKANKEKRHIPLTVVKDVKGDDSLMKDELFGPVLPIVTVPSLDKAVEFVNERPHALALYLFTRDDSLKAKVASNTQSGAVIFNEVVIQPGGTGNSGYGAHTGKYSFDMFTHLRSSLDQPTWMDRIMGGRFPPYTERNRSRLGYLMYPSLPARPTGPPSSYSRKQWWGKRLLLAIFIVVLAKLVANRRLDMKKIAE